MRFASLKMDRLFLLNEWNISQKKVLKKVREEKKKKKNSRINICDESKMSVAHCSVDRIAHNFRFLVVICSGCRINFNSDIIQARTNVKQRKIQPSHIIIIVKIKLNAMASFRCLFSFFNSLRISTVSKKCTLMFNGLFHASFPWLVMLWTFVCAWQRCAYYYSFAYIFFSFVWIENFRLNKLHFYLHMT